MVDDQRRLAAIVFSDIVAYTARMAASERAALRLRDLHRSHWASSSEAHGGRIADENGDELVLHFDSGIGAVRCALGVLAAVRSGGLALRVGVHSGEVLLRDGRLYGDAVNLAARVRAEAEPGGLVVTDEVARSIRNQGLEVQSIGSRKLKNVPGSVTLHRVGDATGSEENSGRPRRFKKALVGVAIGLLVVVAAALGFPETRDDLVAAAMVQAVIMRRPPDGHEVAVTTSADGTRIAWARYGTGPPVLFVQNWLTNVEAMARGNPLLASVAEDHQMVLFDGRGFGLSQRGVAHSPAARVADVEAVVAAAGLERFSILAMSAGTPTAITYAARHPERVDRMVLFGATARPRMTESQNAIAILMRDHFEARRFKVFFGDYFVPDGTRLQQLFFQKLLGLSGGGEDIYPFWQSWAREDVREEARRVRAPTLVVNVRDDRIIPLEAGLEVANLVPDAVLLILEGRNHVLLPGDSEGDRARQAFAGFLAPTAARAKR